MLCGLIHNGIEINFSDYFIILLLCTRGHSFKLHIQTACYNLDRIQFFQQDQLIIIDVLNDLPKIVLEAQSFYTFKNLIYTYIYILHYIYEIIKNYKI